MNKTGIELIAEERQDQIEKHGWTLEHDKGHTLGELAMAAACYASPKPIFEIVRNDDTMVTFVDPYPFYDHYYQRGEPVSTSIRTIEKKAGKSRIKQLQIAGALIAAEIDILLAQSSNSD